MTEISEKEQALLDALWDSIPTQASVVLGVDVELGKMKILDELPDLSKKQYTATLSTERPQPANLYLAFDDRTAIAFSGLLVMMQEKVINEKMSRREMDEDDLDAMSECVNQIGSAINSALHAHLGSEYHVVVSGGAIEPPETLERYLGGRIVSVGGKISVGTLHKGDLKIIVPELLFTGVAPEDASSEEVALTADEADALRQATLDGLTGEEAIAILLPIAREHDYWEKILDLTGITTHIAKTLHETRKLCRAGEVQVVLVDADACAHGGLPDLARLLSWHDVSVPVLVAASQPTRTHLVACLAAGVSSYLVKPVDSENLRVRVNEALADWQERPMLPPDGEG